MLVCASSLIFIGVYNAGQRPVARQYQNNPDRLAVLLSLLPFFSFPWHAPPVGCD